MRERQRVFVEKKRRLKRQRECEERKKMKRNEKKETVGNYWRKMKRCEGVVAKLHVV